MTAPARDPHEDERDIVEVVLYAMRSGCFFPVPRPKPPYKTGELLRWGAMRNLHAAVARLTRETC